jgi:hypothetical protein
MLHQKLYLAGEGCTIAFAMQWELNQAFHSVLFTSYVCRRFPSPTLMASDVRLRTVKYSVGEN